jgi:hypothetical protein
MRRLVRQLAAVRGKLENPLRINPGQRAREELRSLHDLAGNDPLRLAGARLGRGRVRLGPMLPGRLTALEEGRSGKDIEETVPCGLVAVAFLAPGDVAGQPGKDRAVNGVIGRVALVEL